MAELQQDSKQAKPLTASEAAEMDDIDNLFTFHQQNKSCCPCATKCFVHTFTQSFGPIGLLAGDMGIPSAVVDTGASMTITPYKSDFISYETLDDKVVEGLAKGSQIVGMGMIHWRIEVDGRTVDLKL